MNNPMPSPWRIFSVDYPAMLAALFPLIGWGLYLAADVFNLISDFGKEGGLSWLWVAVLFTAVGVPAFVWRMSLIRGLLSSGEETTGLVQNVSFYRDRGRVEYSFVHQGQQIAGWNALHKCRYTTPLYLGQEVTVMFDPQNPKKALIKELYVD